jgi:hypothetical protein
MRESKVAVMESHVAQTYVKASPGRSNCDTIQHERRHEARTRGPIAVLNALFPYMQRPHHEAVPFLTSEPDDGNWPGSHSACVAPGNEATVFTGEQTEYFLTLRQNPDP